MNAVFILLQSSFDFSPSAEPVSKPPQNAFRQWLYHDGFIQLKANKKLVIGVQENGDEVIMFVILHIPVYR